MKIISIQSTLLACLFASSFLLAGCEEEPTPVCGDGKVNTSLEECDEGEATETCTELCTIPVCGDGLLTEGIGEECDDANEDDTDGCRMDCFIQVCGDGLHQPGEECDDRESE